jgi:hypothetical protein
LWGDSKGAFALPLSSRNAKNTRLVDWLVVVISIDLKRLQAQSSNQRAGERSGSPTQFNNDALKTQTPMIALSMVVMEMNKILLKMLQRSSPAAVMGAA